MEFRVVTKNAFCLSSVTIGTGFSFTLVMAGKGVAYAEEGVEVLTHGPIHEAFAETVEFDSQEGMLVQKAPPEPIEEMPPDQRDRFLSNIHNEANRIQKIIDRMLELSALENQKILQKRESISFPSLIKTVLEGKRPMLSKKKLSLANNVQEHILIQGDSFLLHQAISNLIQNAIDFSPAHSNISLSGRVEAERMRFTVDDNGSGIPDYAIEKIFDKFFSLHRPDSGKKSTGLGLNFVKEVVTLHNGEIKLENRPEKGVRATLILPL